MEEMADLTSRVSTRLKENYGQSASPVQDMVVDPELGFVKRIPPMEKTVRHTSALGAYTPTVQPEREPLPEIFRGEPIYFKSALETGAGAVKISKGDELQAILCEDGKYNLSEPNETYAFARVSADELDYWQTGVEVKPASPSFRPQ